MPQSTHSVRPLGKSIALVALTALMAYGCERTKSQQASIAPNKPAAGAPAAPTSPSEHPTAAPVEQPVNPPADKPVDKAVVKPPAPGDKPALPPIPHDEIARDAKPLRQFTTPTGVIVQEFKEGSGVPTLPKAVVTIHFVFYVQDGWKKMESTWENGEPNTNSLEEIVPGLGDGLIGMKAGGVRRVIVPPDRGFKDRPVKDREDPDKIVIPANSTLVFDVELVSNKQRIVDKPKANPKAAPAPEPNK